MELPEMIYGSEEIKMEPLQCLRPMVWYYLCIHGSIRHLAGDKDYESDDHFTKMSPEQVREFRRYINSDLENYGLEFYLQRAAWADKCKQAKGDPGHERKAKENPAKHPCQMKGGFRRIVEGEKYTYEEFLGETLPISVAIHAHLVSINRALGDLYYYATELPFAAFTPVGKSEILHLTTELHRIIIGLFVATHLQPQAEWQRDLANYLITCRADCQRFFETIPRYYQTHRMRLVIFQIEPDTQDTHMSKPYPHPLACLPWSAGVYLDFLAAYENIVRHAMAVIHWTIRLHSRWSFVPRRYLRLISPFLRV
jgi:hypothetical protein